MKSLIILATLALAACGTEHGSSPSQAASPSPTPSPAAAPSTSPSESPELPSFAPIGDPRPAVSIEPVLATLLTKFKADMAKHGVKAPSNVPELRTVDFVPTMPGIVGGDMLGYCQTMEGTDIGGNPYTWNVLHIQIPADSPLAQNDADYTESATSFDLKVLAYHEFTHCILGRNHTTDAAAITSIMYADLVPVTDHSDAAWSALVEQLFSPAYQATLPLLTY